MPEFKLGWVVGFLEGEGNFLSVGSRCSRTARELRCEASQVQLEPLQRLVRYAGIGKVQGPFIRKRKNHQPIYSWRVYGSAAATFMETIRPHMSPRRQEQIAMALAFYGARVPKDHMAIGRKAAATRLGRLTNDPRQLRIV